MSPPNLAVGLYAARYGLECLPAEAVYRVDVLEALLELAGEWGQVAKRVAVSELTSFAGSGHPGKWKIGQERPLIEYARLDEADRARVDGILAGTGCEALLARPAGNA